MSRLLKIFPIISTYDPCTKYARQITKINQTFIVDWDSSVGIETCYGLGGGDRIPMEARFSAPVHTDPRSHLSSYTIGTGLFPVVRRPGRGVYHPTHLTPTLKKE